MSDFAPAYSQPAALIRRPKGKTLRPAADAEHPLTSREAYCFQGQPRGSSRTATPLTKLAKAKAARMASQRAVLRDLVVTAGTGPQRGAAFSLGNGSLGKLFPALLKEDHQHLRSLSSVPFRATIQIAATPTA